MLNWFTFGVMFLTIGLLILTCFYLEFKRSSEDFTIENLLNTYKQVINKLEDENKELKQELESKKKEIKLMKSININDYIKKGG